MGKWRLLAEASPRRSDPEDCNSEMPPVSRKAAVCWGAVFFGSWIPWPFWIRVAKVHADCACFAQHKCQLLLSFVVFSFPEYSSIVSIFHIFCDYIWKIWKPDTQFKSSFVRPGAAARTIMRLSSPNITEHLHLGKAGSKQCALYSSLLHQIGHMSV